ncbi:unnamed protein product [Camellia sinensis]
MASRFRSISRPTLGLLKSTITTKPKSIPCLRTPLSSATLPRQNPSHTRQFRNWVLFNLCFRCTQLSLQLDSPRALALTPRDRGLCLRITRSLCAEIKTDIGDG